MKTEYAQSYGCIRVIASALWVSGLFPERIPNSRLWIIHSCDQCHYTAVNRRKDTFPTSGRPPLTLCLPHPFALVMTLNCLFIHPAIPAPSSSISCAPSLCSRSIYCSSSCLTLSISFTVIPSTPALVFLDTSSGPASLVLSPLLTPSIFPFLFVQTRGWSSSSPLPLPSPLLFLFISRWIS